MTLILHICYTIKLYIQNGWNKPFIWKHMSDKMIQFLEWSIICVSSLPECYVYNLCKPAKNATYIPQRLSVQKTKQNYDTIIVCFDFNHFVCSVSHFRKLSLISYKDQEAKTVHNNNSECLVYIVSLFCLTLVVLVISLTGAASDHFFIYTVQPLDISPFLFCAFSEPATPNSLSASQIFCTVCTSLDWIHSCCSLGQ